MSPAFLPRRVGESRAARRLDFMRGNAQSHPAGMGRDAMSEADRNEFQRVARSAEASIVSLASEVVWDGSVRAQYREQIRRAIADFERRATLGEITWAQAAERVNIMRNDTMEALRLRSSPVGRSIAEWLKAEGKTLNELIARYTIKLHGPNARFDALTAAEKNAVYAEIVQAAGRSNPKVNLWLGRASRAGKGLIVLSVAYSIYAISTSDDPAATARREVAVTGAGIAGGVAGGALAGLACGPGAPVCVTVGAFIGGALAAFGVDFAFGW